MPRTFPVILSQKILMAVVLIVVAVGFALKMKDVAAQLGVNKTPLPAKDLFSPTGYTGADCTACGNKWPWSPTCRWSPARVVQIGYYREYEGDKGSATCHTPESSLPYSEDVGFEIGARLLYQLKVGSWDELGLEATVSKTMTINDRVLRSNSCNTPGCCLKPLKGYCRYGYKQYVRDREIASEVCLLAGTLASAVSKWDKCMECSDQTKRFSVLCEKPTAELLSAYDVSIISFPYEKPLLTINTYCNRK